MPFALVIVNSCSGLHVRNDLCRLARLNERIGHLNEREGMGVPVLLDSWNDTQQ